MASTQTDENRNVDETRGIADKSTNDTANRKGPPVNTVNDENSGSTIASQVNDSTVSGIFMNLPVRDLARTIEFFSRLGFKFNPKFTDHNGTCMIISKNAFVMLLTEEFFKTFTEKEVNDSFKSTEILISLQVKTREEVDSIVKMAVELGGHIYAQPQDHGWMYGWSFEDLDGHQWELFCMDEKQMPAEVAENTEAGTNKADEKKKKIKK